MSKFKMLKDKNRLKDSGEKGSQQGEGRIPGRADPLPGPSVQLELGLRFLQQIQAVIFQKAVGRGRSPLRSSFESTPWGEHGQASRG